VYIASGTVLEGAALSIASHRNERATSVAEVLPMLRRNGGWWDAGNHFPRALADLQEVG
jgi:hypothetical protein